MAATEEAPGLTPALRRASSTAYGVWRELRASTASYRRDVNSATVDITCFVEALPDERQASAILTL